MSNEIVSTAVQVFAPSEAKLELSKSRTMLHDLIEKHKAVKLDLSEIEDKKERKAAYDAAKSAWSDYNDPRIDFGKKYRATYKDLKSQVDSFKEEGEEIEAEWMEQEKKFHKVWKDEDDRKKIESARLAQEELDRIAHIKSRIEDLKNLPLAQINSDSEALDTAIRNLLLIEINDSFQEFNQEAKVTKDLVLTTLQNMFNAKIKVEQIAIQQAEENSRLEAERKAFEEEKSARKAEQESKEKAERERIAEEDRIRNEKIAEEKRVRDAEVAAKQKILDDKQAELDRQAQLIADQQAEAHRVEQEKIAQNEAKEAAKKESERIKKEQEEIDRAAKAYKDKIEKMTALEAFQDIRKLSKDSFVVDICDAQIRKLELKKAS